MKYFLYLLFQANIVKLEIFAHHKTFPNRQSILTTTIQYNFFPTVIAAFIGKHAIGEASLGI